MRISRKKFRTFFAIFVSRPSVRESFKLKHTVWTNGTETIIELGCHKISGFVSVSQINYLPKNNKSSLQWQITTFLAQSRPIIANYLQRVMGKFTFLKMALPKYDYGECFTKTKWKTWKNEGELIRVMACPKL